MEDTLNQAFKEHLISGLAVWVGLLNATGEELVAENYQRQRWERDAVSFENLFKDSVDYFVVRGIGFFASPKRGTLLQVFKTRPITVDRDVNRVDVPNFIYL